MFRFVARLAPQVAKQVQFQPMTINFAKPLARNFCTAYLEYEEDLPKDPMARLRELRDRRMTESKLKLEAKYRVIEGLKTIAQLSTAEVVHLLELVDASDMKLKKYQVEQLRNDLAGRSDLGASAEQMTAVLSVVKYLCPDTLTHSDFFVKLNTALQATPPFTPELFAEAVSGLTSFYYVDPAVRAVLPTLTAHLQQITDPFSCDTLGMLIHGLHGMNSEYPEARALISVLVERLQQAEGRFSANGYSNALYGLFFMSSEHEEVRALVQELTNRATWEQFTANEFGNAFLGLNALSSEHPETLELVRFLADKLAQSDVVLDSKLVGCMVYGCTSMKADKPEVLELLAALAVKIRGSKAYMSHHDVELAVEALANMDANVEEVREIFSALHIKSKMCKPELDVDTVRRLQVGAGVKKLYPRPYMVDLNSDQAPQLMTEGLFGDDRDSAHDDSDDEWGGDDDEDLVDDDNDDEEMNAAADEDAKKLP